mmetsp:Transcript_15321/g.36556  ORF Transcript_15321/g.36556 Transcript_15321/m.36556 type:complete len:272 (-) Transcript_15321:132-947(-)
MTVTWHRATARTSRVFDHDPGSTQDTWRCAHRTGQASASGLEPVADTRFGHQPLRAVGVGLDLLAQVGHVHTDIVHVIGMARPPHGLQQMLMRQHPSRRVAQLLQQTVFDRRQMQLFAALLRAARHDTPCSIHRDRPEAQHRVGIGATRAPAQLHPHPGQQLGHTEGLDQIVIGAGVERLDLALFTVAGRQHQHRGLRPAAKLANEIEPIAVRQPEVQHHQLRPARGRVDQAALQARRLEHLQALAFQRQAHETPDLRLVLDHQHARRTHR